MDMLSGLTESVHPHWTPARAKEEKTKKGEPGNSIPTPPPTHTQRKKHGAKLTGATGTQGRVLGRCPPLVHLIEESNSF